MFELIDVKGLDLNEFSDHIPKECVLDIHLEYPKELLDLRNYYPLAPEKTENKEDFLSDYCKMIMNVYDVSVGKVKKLVPNLFDNEQYVLHYKNLKLYLKLTMRLKNNHRVLEFY